MNLKHTYKLRLEQPGRSRYLGLLALALATTATAEQVTSGGVIRDDRAGDWVSHGRTHSEQRFSPLEEITTDNIDRLGLSWYIDLPEKRSLQATPLVVDGIMYFTISQSIVYAVDALTGETIWVYDPQVAERLRDTKGVGTGWGHNRGVAFHEGKIYVGTTDGRLIAIDADSGRMVWSATTFPPGTPYSISGAPRVIGDKVVIGNGGAEHGPVRGYVTAYDADTGRQLWRFYTVPGNPADGFENTAMREAAQTWSGEWWTFGGGGNVWNAITTDPKYNRIYIGTGNGSPWNQSVRSPGGGDNLFLSSIVALDAESGNYLWHYQTTPAENWDFNSAMDIVLAELDIEGAMREVILHAPKNGFFYVLDRETGRLLSAEKFGKVTWADRVDGDTGRPVENPEARNPGGEVLMWPGPFGAHNWHSMSFNPDTGLVYIPTIEVPGYYDARGISADTFKPGEFQFLTGYRALEKDVPAGAGSSGLLAWDPAQQTGVWHQALRGVWNGGTVTTAGGLVFHGTGDGFLHGYDAENGERLWSFDAGLGISAAPISYAVNGQQFISVLVGWGGGSFMGTSLLAEYGWQYGKQQRRLLTFALDGDQSLPVVPASTSVSTLAKVSDGVDSIDVESAKRGSALYAVTCAMCHGGAAVPSGGAPDLRSSTIASTAESLQALLHSGPLQSAGMPAFPELKPSQIVDLYWYIRSRARDSMASSGR